MQRRSDAQPRSEEAKKRRASDNLLFQLWLLRGFTANTLPNVAPSGTATQSSTYAHGDASHAIDGNKNTQWEDGSCTHTYDRLHSWWSLRWPAMYSISSISITNRNVAGERISNVDILIGNSLDNNGNNNPRCTVIDSIPDGATSTFDCGGMIGRVVNLYHGGYDPESVISVCELEVYGELYAAPAPSVSAEVNGRSIVLVDKKLSWSDALFYCRDFHRDLLSIRSREEQWKVKELLGNPSFPITGHVWLGLRRYLMGDTWFWMSGDPNDFSRWRYQTLSPIRQSSSPCGGIEASSPFHWTDHSCEDRLNFFCFDEDGSDVQRVTFVSSARSPKLPP